MIQRICVEFLEDWADRIQPVYADGEKGSLLKAIAAIRDITISSQSETNSVESELAASRSAFASVEAKSKHQLPIGFTFNTEPYDGFEVRTFMLRLSVITGEKEPTLKLRLVNKGEIVESIEREFEAKLRDAVPDGLPIYLGTFSP